MTPTYLIDADCAIYAMGATTPALRVRLGRCRPGEIALSAISLAEIALGNVFGKSPPKEVLDAIHRAGASAAVR